MRCYLVVDKSYVLPLYDKGTKLYMVDFEEDDQRNMARRITHRDMLTPEKLKSKNTFFFRREDDHE